MGITTAIFGSIEITAEGLADPMLKYTRTFQACVGLAAAALLFVPFLRIGTQGNAPQDDTTEFAELPGASGNSSIGLASREGSKHADGKDGQADRVTMTRQPDLCQQDKKR